MAKLDSIVIAQQNSLSQIIGWQFIPYGAEEPKKATVTIFRSYVQNDSFEQIATVAATKGWYFDEDVDLLDRWKVAFYKLILKVDGEATEYGPVYVSSNTTVRDRTLVKHANTRLKLSGSPVLIYQEIGMGPPCDVCWDPILRRVTQSNCTTCFGSGVIKGYHFPVLTLAQLGVEGKQNTVNERVEQEAAIEMLFSNYPILRPGDVVYAIDVGRRYRIQQVLPAQRGHILINQATIGYALQTTDVEEKLPIPDISTLTPILKRKYAPHRKVSSTDGEEFDHSTFDNTRY